MYRRLPSPRCLQTQLDIKRDARTVLAGRYVARVARAGRETEPCSKEISQYDFPEVPVEISNSKVNF